MIEAVDPSRFGTRKLMRRVTRPSALSDRAERAHAQKNCLSVVLAVAWLIGPELSRVGRQRLDRLRSAAYRMRDLLDEDLGETAKAVAVEIDVECFWGHVCEMLRDRAEAAKVTLVVRCRGGRMQGIEKDLREAVFNLAANALEATPPGGAVRVETSVTNDGDQLWTIRDAGEGIDEEVLRQVGVPHRSFRPGGSGLGVAIAHKIVSKLGGSLQFESARGNGTTVTIRLPPYANPARSTRAFGG
jgi:signal transduction histidine kinase